MWSKPGAGMRASHRVAQWSALGVGAACAVAGYITDGTAGLLGATVGTVLVVAFLSSGLIPVLLVRDIQVGASMGTAVLLLTYTLRLALALVVLVLVGRSDAVNPQWVGLTVVVTALTWLGVHVAHAIRRSRREPTVNPSTDLE